jgi:hypothetical protein
MRMMIVVLAASAVLSACVSDTGSQAWPPNYITCRGHQAPAIRNDTFGGAAMPMRGLPRWLWKVDSSGPKASDPKVDSTCGIRPMLSSLMSALSRADLRFRTMC